MTRTQLVAAFGTGVCALFVASAESQAAPNDQAPEAAPADSAAPPPMVAPTAHGRAGRAGPVATAPAPRKPAPNSIYAEGLGAGLAYSLNYERMVLDDLGVRLGFSYLSMSASASSGAPPRARARRFSRSRSPPATSACSGNIPRAGGGVTLTRSSGSGSSFGQSASGSGMSGLGSVMVGYRIHPVDHAGFNFRIGLMALAGKGLGLDNADPSAFGFLPWGYISMGASF